MQHIKYVYRIQGGKVTAQLFLDGEETPEAAGGTASANAKRFLETFYPQRLLQEHAAVLGENTLLVFRTDETQMEEFAALLREYGA